VTAKGWVKPNPHPLRWWPWCWSGAMPMRAVGTVGVIWSPLQCVREGASAGEARTIHPT